MTEPEPVEPLMVFFEYYHLRPSLQATSRPFYEMALSTVRTLPRNAERTVCLRKLMEAKDAAVRCKIIGEMDAGAGGKPTTD